MKISKLILLCVAIFASVTVNAQKREDIAKKMNLAGDALNAKKYAESIKIFQEALKMIKSSAEENVDELQPIAEGHIAGAHRANGMSMAYGKKFEPAVGEFKLALGMFKKANNIQKVREMESFISNCYAQMANAKLKENKFDEAIAICNKGIAENKSDTKLMLLIALCNEKANKDDDAIKAYELVMTAAKTSPRLKADGDKAKASLVNGQLVAATKLSEKGQTQQALVRITTALKYDPKSSQAEYLKISVYNKAKDFASVVKFGPIAVTHQQSEEMKSDLNFMIGAAYVALNDNTNALNFYKKVTKGKYVTMAKDQISQIEKAAEAAAK